MSQEQLEKIYSREHALIQHALKRMANLLSEYRAVADGASYYFAEAEVRRLHAEASHPSAPDEQQELRKRILRQARALARAVDEWRGEVRR